MEKFLAAIGGIVLAIAIIVGAALLFALPVMWLWNWLMPLIFGLIKINIWQAWGLSVLSGLLLKSTSTSSK